MKENKYGIVISLVLTILSLIGSISLTEFWWWQNFSFAILGGTFCSLIIFTANYIILLKKHAVEIVFDVYNINSSGFSVLYSTKGNKSLEQFMEVLCILTEKAYVAYVKVNELLSAVYWFSKRKKLLTEIKEDIDKFLVKLYQIDSYIEIYPQEAKTNSKKLYNDLDSLINSKELYLKSLKMAQSFHCNISSLEEYKTENEIKQKCADKYKKHLQSIENSQPENIKVKK